MESDQPARASYTLAAHALRSLFGGSSAFPNPDDSNPPGPWGPVIRRAEQSLRSILEAQLLVWRDVFGPVPDPWRAAYAQALAEEVIDRTTLMQETADAMAQAGNTHAIIIIGGYLSRFIDDCGTGRIRQGHVPHPPRHGEDGHLGAFELVVMAARFEQAAAATSNERLRREFGKAGERLLEAGAGRLQSATAQSAG
ncbi:MAG: hypothetical protein LC746_17585 [Acidobacteria bacterium]|nr:hypothetical protein [Acidobacteriota bacterium]